MDEKKGEEAEVLEAGDGSGVVRGGERGGGVRGGESGIVLGEAEGGEGRGPPAAAENRSATVLPPPLLPPSLLPPGSGRRRSGKRSYGRRRSEGDGGRVMEGGDAGAAEREEEEVFCRTSAEPSTPPSLPILGASARPIRASAPTVWRGSCPSCRC